MKSSTSPLSIAIVYSVPSVTEQNASRRVADEDTEYSAKLVESALKGKYQPFLVPIHTNTIQQISSIKADCIFNLIEWTGAELPCSLAATKAIEQLGIPYTGASPSNYETMTDKVQMKLALTEAELPTPEFQIFFTGDEPISSSLPFPVIAKLGQEHCSIGLSKDSVVQSADQLRGTVKNLITTYQQPVIVEEFITGREFQVTAIETEDGVVVLPPAEIVFSSPNSLQFLTFNSRWDDTHQDYYESRMSVFGLSEKETRAIESVTLLAFQTLKFRDYTRLDIRLRNDIPYILEANANPGMDDNNQYGITVSCEAAGILFPEYLDVIIRSALRRANLVHTPLTV